MVLPAGRWAKLAFLVLLAAAATTPAKVWATTGGYDDADEADGGDTGTCSICVNGCTNLEAGCVKICSGQITQSSCSEGTACIGKHGGHYTDSGSCTMT